MFDKELDESLDITPKPLELTIDYIDKRYCQSSKKRTLKPPKQTDAK